MKLYFYRGDSPNFGDELNEVLIPKFFPGLFDDDPGTLFLAIGSVLFNHHSKSAKKIVFGSGYAGYTALPEVDETWTFHAVRGPLTAHALGLEPDKVAADAAVLLAVDRPPPRRKLHRVSFMPHWQSMVRGHWHRVCDLAGVNLLDPREPVEKVLDALSSSEVVVTEAMHGAIVSDALRVPWVAIRPFDARHHYKWTDWSRALDTDVRFVDVAPSSVQERLVRMFGKDKARLNMALRRSRLEPVLDRIALDRCVATLARAARSEPQLSPDRALERGVDRLLNAAAAIKRAHGVPA
jgi:hypothetical protein